MALLPGGRRSFDERLTYITANMELIIVSGDSGMMSTSLPGLHSLLPNTWITLLLQGLCNSMIKPPQGPNNVKLNFSDYVFQHWVSNAKESITWWCFS